MVRKGNIVISAMFLTLAVFVIFSTIGLGQTSNTVDVKSKEGIGKYLTDATGKTLYYFKKDTPGKSACAGPCVEKWPLFYSEKVVAPSGLDAKDFGMITRDDGKKQSTYKDMPLYYFFSDRNPGDTNGQGQGLGGNWFVAEP